MSKRTIDTGAKARLEELKPTRDPKGGSSVSNVLKTRHDTAKNSISNVR